MNLKIHNIRKLVFCANPRNVQEKHDQDLSFVFISLVVTVFLTNAFAVVNDLTGGGNQHIVAVLTYTIKGLFVVTYLVNIKLYFQKVYIWEITILIVVFLLFLVSGVLVSDDMWYKTTLVRYVTLCFTAFTPIVKIKDYETLLNGISRISVIILFLSGLILLLGFKMQVSYYYMGFSNALIIPVLSQLYCYFKKGKVFGLVLTLVGVVTIVSLGSRTALLCILIYFMTCLLFGRIENKQESENYNRRKLFIIIFMVITVPFSGVILGNLYIYLTGKGVWARTLWTILNHYMLKDREGIYRGMVEEIMKHPFRFRGITGEALYVGTTAHNFILELLMQMGVLLGGLFLFIIIVYGLELYVCGRKAVYFDLANMLFCASIPMMLVSGSIWTTVCFWPWLFVMIKNSRFKFRLWERKIGVGTDGKGEC